MNVQFAYPWLLLLALLLLPLFYFYARRSHKIKFFQHGTACQLASSFLSRHCQAHAVRCAGAVHVVDYRRRSSPATGQRATHTTHGGGLT